MLQGGEQGRAGKRSGNASRQQNQPHLDVDIAASPMGENPGKTGGEKLIGLGGHRHGGVDADEDQQRRHQKTAADAEQTRQEAHQRTHSQQQKNVNRHFRYWQIDLHSCTPGPLAACLPT